MDTYKPYFNDYKRWQNNLFDSIKGDKNILVITSDLQKYYHSIEIDKLKSKVTDLMLEIESDYNDFFLNDLLFDMIIQFNETNNGSYKKAFDYGEKFSNYGLPLTLNVSRILANIYLMDFDEDIINNLKPIYYGRYVDDIIIAVENKGYDINELNLWNVLKPLEKYSIQADNSIVELSDGEFSKMKFNGDKENIFIFNGNDDIIEINQLKKSINKTSSEWKLIPDTSDYDDVDNMDLFHELNKDCEDVNGLRKSNGLILKRNKFIKEIISFESYIVALPFFKQLINIKIRIKKPKLH